MSTKVVRGLLGMLWLGLMLQLGGCASVESVVAGMREPNISAARNGKLPRHPGTRVMVLCNGVTDPVDCERSFAYALEQHGVFAASGSERHATLAFAALKDGRRYVTGGSMLPLFAVYPAPVGKFDAVLLVSVTWQKDGKRFSVQSLLAPYRVDSKGHPYLGYARREMWNALNLPVTAKGQFAYSAAGFFILKGYLKAGAKDGAAD